ELPALGRILERVERVVGDVRADMRHRLDAVDNAVGGAVQEVSAVRRELRAGGVELRDLGVEGARREPSRGGAGGRPGVDVIVWIVRRRREVSGEGVAVLVLGLDVGRERIGHQGAIPCCSRSLRALAANLPFEATSAFALAITSSGTLGRAPPAAAVTP